MIKDVFEFILENWRFFSVIFLILCSLFLHIFKKKVKVVDDIVLDIISKLPVLISKAENRYPSGNGQLKKVQVLDAALMIYKNLTGVALTYDSEIAIQIDKAIENILNTPQKKGE